MSIYKPLNADEIVRKIGCKFILYENMHKIRHINELLPQCLILYQLADVGHFCCVFKNKEGINFFDSLGIKMDNELYLANGKYKNHDFTYLTKLLYEANTKVIFNEYQLQNIKTSTCGHWCAIRMKYYDLFNDEFYKIFKNKKNRDQIVVKLFNKL